MPQYLLRSRLWGFGDTKPMPGAGEPPALPGLYRFTIRVQKNPDPRTPTPEPHMWRLFCQPLCKAVEEIPSQRLGAAGYPPGDASTAQQPGGFCGKRNGRMGRYSGYKPLRRFPTGFLQAKNLSTCEDPRTPTPDYPPCFSSMLRVVNYAIVLLNERNSGETPQPGNICHTRSRLPDFWRSSIMRAIHYAGSRRT